MLFQTHKSFVRLRNTIWDILDENREVCDCPIDCQTINTVKAQKSMKSIVRIAHLPSVVQPWRYEAMRLHTKKPLHSTIRWIVVDTESVHSLRSVDILQIGATLMQRRQIVE